LSLVITVSQPFDIIVPATKLSIAFISLPWLIKSASIFDALKEDSTSKLTIFKFAINFLNFYVSLTSLLPEVFFF